MSASDALRLVLLSTLWGMSFIFMRVAAPEFGPTTLILLRMGIAALVLAPLLLGAGRLKMLWEHKGSLAVLGLTSQALPFCLLALATTQLEAGFTSLINATTPLFTALLGMALFATPIQKQQYLGLAVAFSGVYVLSSDRLDFQLGGDGWFILAALGATFCYGF
ncbi:DMT family transporter, partial [Cobetia marina]